MGYPACRKDPELSCSINVGGTQTLVSATPADVPIFFASTGSTYGKLVEELCTETTPLNPLSDYARQKVEAEDILKSHKEFVIYRFATAFGVSPRLRLDLLVNDFVYKAVCEKTLIVYEKHFKRTFIHVRDMAHSFIFAFQNYERMRGETYNVGDDSMNYSKEEICKAIKNKLDFFLHFADVGHDLDQRNYMVSYNKLNDIGFRTSVTLEEGIEELIKTSQVIEVNNPYLNA